MSVGCPEVPAAALGIIDWPISAAPRADSSPDLDVDAALASLLDRLDADGYSLSVSGSPASWSARVSISAGDAIDALLGARVRVMMSAAAVGLPTEPVVRAETGRDDVLDEDLARPQIPDLVSGPEAAAIAGVSHQRWHQLVAANPDRLRPAINRPSAMLWFRAGVASFAEDQRKPGRPSRQAS